MIAEQPESPEHDNWSDAALDAVPVLSRRVLHRLGWVVVAVLVVVLLIVLPPLLNVSHYQRRVAQAITASIGRPVHFDTIHLHLLPLPGLTIQNFVVEEDPAFGTEPALRANTVEARLRLLSLWRRRIEVSHITLQSPSINIVRREDGRWSLQGVVTEAAHLESAPTVQGRAGAAPRFPYIEATDARINIKAGDHKLPWSILDAKLALWLPDATEWRVRLRGRPLRTDTDVSDVGDLDLEGSLGRASSGTPGGVLDQPLAVSARWASTPLGEAAKLFLGRDTDFRGAASAELEIRGTPAHMQLSSELHLHNLRRSEFVPRLPMSVDAHCRAEATGIVHALQGVRCAVPTAQSDGLFDSVFRSHDQQLTAAPSVLLLQAEVPDLLHLATATATIDLQSASPEYLLNWSRVLSSRVPESVAATGAFSLHAGWNAGGRPELWTLDAICHCTLSPPFANTAAVEPDTRNPGSAASPAGAHPATAETTTAAPASTATATAGTATLSGNGNPPWTIRLTRSPVATGPDILLPGSTDIVLSAGRDLPLSSTAATPAGIPAVVQAAPDRVAPFTAVHGRITGTALSLQYASPLLARYAAGLFPPLGDNFPADLAAATSTVAPVQSEREWGEPQTWTANPAPSATPRARRRSHR